MTKIDDYSDYVTHPRYGQRPHITGLNPKHDDGGDVFLHWHSPDDCRIPNTAIRADRSRQAPATVPVTYYFDTKRQCHDCSRPFIFFAEEQKYWYEELGFGLESDCVRCVPCRKQQQAIARARQTYEELFHSPDRTLDQTLEMVECCLSLIEASVFHPNQIQHIRMLLKQLPSELSQGAQEKVSELNARLRSIETKNSG